jgi:hypothetical protein
MRTQVIPVALLLVVLASAATEHVCAQTGDVIDDPEVYAVYASLLPARFSSGDNDVTRVVLLEETQPRLPCLPTVPPEWTAVVESYNTANARVRKLMPGFNLGMPYSLVSVTELMALVAESLTVMAARDRAVETSSVPRALVSVRYDCGFNCSGGWVVLREKNGGRWGQPTWDAPTCTWTA